MVFAAGTPRPPHCDTTNRKNVATSMLIHTPHLRLFTCTAEHLEAIVRDPASLGTLLNLSIPEGWPSYPPAYPQMLEMLEQQPLLPLSGWWLYLFVNPEERTLVGCGGFRSVPDPEGVVEVGCEIAPAHRGHGYAAEATCGLVRYAFTRPEVVAVDGVVGGVVRDVARCAQGGPPRIPDS